LGATFVSEPANHREREGDRGDPADKKKQEEPTSMFHLLQELASGKQMYPPPYIYIYAQTRHRERNKKRGDLFPHIRQNCKLVEVQKKNLPEPVYACIESL